MAGLAITFGFLLNQLATKLGGLIEKARNAGEVLAVSAGNQVGLAIEWAKVAYAQSLDLTFDQIKDAKKQLLDDLSTEIGYIEHHALAELKAIADQGSIALNTLPLSNHFPQLGRVLPAYVARSTSREVALDLFGNFFDAGRSGYSPTLQVAGRSYAPAGSGTLHLLFRVPRDAFPHDEGQLHYVDGQLTVPYAKHVLFVPVKEKATFQVSFVSLPKHAGKFRFFTSRTEMRTKTQSNRGPTHIQESSDDDIPDPIGSGYVWIDSPTPDWFVDPTSVKLNVESAEGDWKNFGNRSNTAGAAWSIATVHHGFGTSGKVHFFLSWAEHRSDIIQIPAEEDADLEWGSSRIFSVPRGGTWTAKYIDFKGSTFDINGPTFENPYIRIMTSGDSVNVVTVP
jgi:hypothetical protein